MRGMYVVIYAFYYLTPYPLSFRRGEWRSRKTLGSDLHVCCYEITG